MAEAVALTRKEQIRKVAEHMFRQKGYAATSMRSIAGEIGIEAASIYSHIKAKEDILHDICFGMAEYFFSAHEEAVSLARNAEEKLRKAMAAHLRIITENIDAAAVFFHDWRHLSTKALQQFKQLRLQYEDAFRKIFREGVAEGTFKAMDEKFIILTLFSTMNWTYEWYKPGGTLTSDALADNLTQIILQGIKA